MGTANLPT